LSFFTSLHSLAARRGDGLRQEFLELFALREALSAANVEELAAHCAEHFSQAGPNPVGEIGVELPEGVLPFGKTGPNAVAPRNKPRLRRNI
jgi:hypothetical protein